MTVERRTNERHTVWLPVQIDAGQLGTAVGVSKNLSSKGLRIEANADVTVGTPVRVRFRVASHERPQNIDGTVVRAERTAGTQSNWPYQLSVEFNDLHPSLELRLRTQLAELQPRPRA